ncbi:MupA/Atu3671 family FMN-dependent luciferase-like monooxygenase [Caldimonas sp.]|uniref:MupA/Atu3671 family FMN-dependent luciferase-like monooxygenase n=1 Tax=Caldimonas sp. TaxID=2838790 RepID=UPI00307E6B2C
MHNPMRAAFIGDESLLIQCAQILQQAGHVIVAVVSRRPAIRHWASQQGVRVLQEAGQLCEAPELQPLDYLFSVSNLSVLPSEVISVARVAAINFHDGPLPEYAGLNTPVWALLNGEREYGITWHLMTDKVDQGAILVQRRFAIDENETAVSLNTKCFEAGIAGFEELLPQLTSAHLSALPQTAPPQRYFRRKDRPAAACALMFDQEAERLCTFVRALDFGSYANPVGLPKFVHGGRLVCVGEARILETRSGLPAGTVLRLDDQSLAVATASFDVELRRLSDALGRPLTPQSLAQDAALVPGVRLQAPAGALAQRLSELDALASVHEGFWRDRLETRDPVELPYVDRSRPHAKPVYVHRDAELPGGDVAFVIAAVVAHLARLADRDGFDLGYADAQAGQRAQDLGLWFAPQVPLRAVVDFAQSFSRWCETLCAELGELRRRGSYPVDLVARSVELRAQAAAAGDPGVFPVAIEVVANLADTRALPGSECTLGISEDGRRIRWVFDASKLTHQQVGELHEQLLTLLTHAQAHPQCPVGELPLLSDAVRDRVLREWNDTAWPVRADACIHHLMAEQAARTPDAVAVVCEDQCLTYAELDRRSNQLARRLARLGVRPDALVGLFVERSVEMMVGLLAVHKAGGAYVPLDPAYPADRIAYMIEDAKVPVLLTQERLRDELPPHHAAVLCLDSDWSSIATESDETFDGGAQPHHLAYVIYTSGSTGRPKGVMVEHRNVVNFFAGMDRHLGEDEPGTWLAVTSLSFDISVLELCWTLTRGFKVVIASDEDRSAASPARGPHADRPVDFSLFYFSSDESEGGGDKYRLLLEGAKYADQHGFAAVWTPERHFHAFGGLYPNPSVTSAAIAAITQRVKIRSGSVVLPLHHPARIAEEWAVVDNLSKGRVGISFASGWQPNDFVLKPENFAHNKQVMLEGIDIVRRLWRGETVSFSGATGQPVEVRTLPRPVQAELPFWVTSAGNPETFVAAGRLGANVLTHLLGQSVEELADKLATYRKAWKEAGHPGEGHVTLMLHTFVGPDEDRVRETVRQPLIEYLRSSLNLVKQYAWSFPAFKRRQGMDEASANIDLQSLSHDEMTALLEHSFNRYYETSGLFGTPQGCLAMVDRIKGIGVDEIACLIDFGVDTETVLSHLEYLNQLRKLSAPRRIVTGDYSLAAQMERHSVTHLQCTPSMARMLTHDDKAVAGLRRLRRMMVGGEALPPSLARDLKALVPGVLMNMYGPTETTIWSAVQPVHAVDGIVPLGRPLANQEIYILDRRQQPVPVGVPGELVIGGQGVVRGYLHRPELTAERFLPHPFRGAAGGRVYRTGDLARQRPDGTVEFLGRLDHQVKVRGYRIELGEIEARLLSHSAVREAVVVAREDSPGDVRLVAYCAPHAGQTPPVAALREHLRAGLPEYMVPSHFVWLPALPQTPNGKIDRKALPAPDHGPAAAPAADFVAPASGLQEAIAAIWRDVLKLPQVGTRDNFFDLGGHSLLAVQAHRRLREALGRELSITDIFRFPTIESLSAYLGREGDDGAAAQQGRDRAQGRRAALQRRLGQRAALTTDQGT